MYKIEISKKCLRELKKLDKHILERAFNIIENKIAKNPHDAKPLKGPYTGLYSCRFADFRIIYEIYQETITIVILRVRHRKDVYDGL